MSLSKVYASSSILPLAFSNFLLFECSSTISIYLSKFAELGTLSTKRAMYEAFIDLEFFESLKYLDHPILV